MGGWIKKKMGISKNSCQKVQLDLTETGKFPWVYTSLPMLSYLQNNFLFTFLFFLSHTLPNM